LQFLHHGRPLIIIQALFEAQECPTFRPDAVEFVVLAHILALCL
jgi:hypothetical protein